MTPRVRLLVALASTGLVGYVLLGSLLTRVLGDSTYSQLTIFNEVVRHVMDSYVEPVDLDRAMTTAEMGLTEALDGDSAYLDPAAFEAYQQQQPAQDADIGVTLTRRYSFLMVVAARPGSPAERAGLRTGDILKTIDGRHSRGVPAPVGHRLLRGAPGSLVKLDVMRARAEPLELTVAREKLAPLAPESRRLEQGPGYVRVADFAAGTADEVRGRIEALKRDGAPSLVLDLRASATGVPAEAIQVAEMFVASGVLARLSGRKYSEQVWKADPARHVWDRPMAVLIDNGTAGPAEILAGALLDAERASLVGRHSFGRAGLQKAVPMPEGGLVLTVAKYTRPNGEPIHGKGLAPTVEVVADAAAQGDEDAGDKPAGDPILERAVELLTAAAPAAA